MGASQQEHLLRSSVAGRDLRSACARSCVEVAAEVFDSHHAAELLGLRTDSGARDMEEQRWPGGLRLVVYATQCEDISEVPCCALDSRRPGGAGCISPGWMGAVSCASRICRT